MIIDIYHGRTLSSWDDVKEQCPFIIMKATEGTTFVDSKIVERIKKAEARDIPYWVYCYLRKGKEADQALFMVDTVKEHVGKNFIGYVLDAEEGNTAENITTALRTLLTKTDQKVMLYCMYADYTRYRQLIETFDERTAFWEARYGLNNGTDTSAKYPPHNACDLLQYTDQGRVSLVPKSTVDMNKVTNKNGKGLVWFTTAHKKMTFPSFPPKGYWGIGDSDPEIKHIQEICNYFMMPSIEVDGVYGPKTEMSVIALQALMWMNKDGKFSYRELEKVKEQIV